MENKTIGDAVLAVFQMLEKAKSRVTDMVENDDVDAMPDVLNRILADVVSDIEGSYYHSGNDGLYALIREVALRMEYTA